MSNESCIGANTFAGMLQEKALTGFKTQSRLPCDLLPQILSRSFP